MSISILVKVVPPPVDPLEVGEQQRWNVVEKELGVTLPSDYFEYAIRYGSGEFGDPLWLEVWNPLSNNFLGFFYTSGVQLLQSVPMPIVGPSGYPLELFPRTPGFLPFGSSLTGLTVGWYTAGKPSRWPILICPPGGGHVQVWLGSLTQFLSQLHREPIRTLMGPRLEVGHERDPVIFTPRLLK